MNRVLVFATIIGSIGVASCQRSANTPAPGGANLRVSAPFVQQTTTFAFDAFQKISAAEAPAKNVFISPLSLHMALGMILNGANAQTAQEIQKTLRLDGQTLADANATYANLLADLPNVDPAVQIKMANSVWCRQEFSVLPTFQNVLRDSFKAEVSALDFDSPAAPQRINQWASNQTNGRIPKVIERINAQDVMFLLNALYFKGNWQTKFDPARTDDATFRTAEGRDVPVRMMRQNVAMRRAFRPNYVAFELPYGAGNVAMTVLLPNAESSANALINTMTATEWRSLQTEMTEGKLDIGLPKFQFSYETNLNNVLTSLGMPSAFDPAQADFSKINPTADLYLSFVKQNTFVAVDEVGTEAAAVTTGGIGVTSLPQSYLCDRPFVFVIHDKTSGTLLFMGRINNPSLTQ